ncbi:MAG: hypothetical protein N7Q72_03575, partial [Spiroplasma sp. Tabriz.8]|nr:hypothetical protein [Spiroplasma sp. Tabriz.8]
SSLHIWAIMIYEYKELFVDVNLSWCVVHIISIGEIIIIIIIIIIIRGIKTIRPFFTSYI